MSEFVIELLIRRRVKVEANSVEEATAMVRDMIDETIPKTELDNHFMPSNDRYDHIPEGHDEEQLRGFREYMMNR